MLEANHSQQHIRVAPERPGSTQPIRSSVIFERGLKPVTELGKDRPHGVRLRYLSGCRCTLCRKANSTYANERAAAIKAGLGNGIVPAAKTRAHLQMLSKKGIGRRTVSDITGVSDTIIHNILNGTRTNVRAQTERLILGVTEDCQADHALISAKPTWKLINELIADGYTKGSISLAIGNKTRALQIGKDMITVRNAALVRRVYDRWRKCNASKSIKLLQELREEGYRQDVIESHIARLAVSLNVDVPSLDVRNNRIRADAARLLATVHAELLE